jgi:hypothetical protein
MPLKGDALVRFWRKVRKLDDGCWRWVGRVKSNGYGTFFPARRDCWNAHRWAYTVLVGPIPDGLELDHTCRNTWCVNPAHLEPVPPSVNKARAAAQRTHCPQGHPYNEENTWWDKRGHRECRVCRAEWRANFVARHREHLAVYYARYHAEHRAQILERQRAYRMRRAEQNR